MCNCHTLSIVKKITSNEYSQLRNFLFKKYGAGKTYLGKNDSVVHCKQFSNEGIKLKLYPCYYEGVIVCFGIELKINMYSVVNGKSRIKILPLNRGNINKFIGKTDSILSEFPSNFNCFDDYNLKRIDITADIELPEPDRRLVIKLANRTYIPYHWKKVLYYNQTQKRKADSDYQVEISSSSRKVVLYDKTYQVHKLGLTDYDGSEVGETLRAEVSLKSTFIRYLQYNFKDIPGEDRLFPSVLLRFLEKEGDYLFMRTINHVFQSGSYFQMKEALTLIQNSSLQRKSKKLLVTFIEECNLRRSADVAAGMLIENGWNKNDVRKVLTKLHKLGINPVTIPRKDKIQVDSIADLFKVNMGTKQIPVFEKDMDNEAFV